MSSRLKKFSQLIIEKNCDAYLVADSTDIRYLVDAPAEDSLLLVTPKKFYYITDARYTQEMREAFGRAITVREFKKGRVQEAFAVIEQKGLKRLGFDEASFSVAQFKAMRSVCPKGVKLVPKNGLVRGMRLVKDESEVQEIRQCIKLNHAVYQYLKRVIKPGMTEREIFFKAETFVRSREAGFSFLPIIAAGSKSAFPHSKISKRVFHSKELLLIDLGIQINGYKSDLTRIFVSSKIPKPVERVYWAVAQAQVAAISEIRAGVPVAQIDQAARKCLKKNKLERFFIHSTGHGVGLDIHEAPRLSEKSQEVLKEGMVVTVEPGVYFPGKFGIRIEDMVLVKEKGCEILSRGTEVPHPFYL